MNIGLFGGTFDPPHIGHLVAAQDACSALALDRLLFVPAAVPPHKQDKAVTRAEIRLEMLRAATAGNAQFQIDTSEIDRAGPSYTVDTLRQLDTKAGDTVFLLIGVDQVREFSAWREPGEILRLARVVMLTRAGDVAAGADFVQQTVPVTRLDISSTLIRHRVGAGETIRYLVPDAVAQIIERERLYQ